MIEFKSFNYIIPHFAFRIPNLISRCGAIGDVSKRTLWVMKRGIRSGSNLVMPSEYANDGRTLVATGSALALGAGHRLPSPKN